MADLIAQERTDSEILGRIRLKYGWHDAEKIVPSHSRHVLVWTNRGEYRAWYDHKWGCWRIRRDGLTATHWREQCGPENWPCANDKEENQCSTAIM